MRFAMPVGQLPTTQLPRHAGTPASGLVELAPGLRPAEVAEVEEALAAIPQEDLDLLAEHSVPLRILATDRIEGTLLGATQIVQHPDGPWVPRQVRVAARNEQVPIAMVLQHEIGHAVSVLRAQDRSEAAADAYADARLETMMQQAAGPVSADTPAGPDVAAAEDPVSPWAAAGAIAALIGLALLAL